MCQTTGCTLLLAGYMHILTSTHCLTTAHRNSQFTPHALLHMPEPTRAYRHIFPTLAVVSFECTLFDVRTGSQIQTLEGIQATPPLQDPIYICSIIDPICIILSLVLLTNILPNFNSRIPAHACCVFWAPNSYIIRKYILHSKALT